MQQIKVWCTNFGSGQHFRAANSSKTSNATDLKLTGEVLGGETSPALLVFPGPLSPLSLRVFPKNGTTEGVNTRRRQRVPSCYKEEVLTGSPGSGMTFSTCGVGQRVVTHEKSDWHDNGGTGKKEDSLRFLGSQAAPSVPLHPEVGREHWVSFSLQLWVQEKILQLTLHSMFTWSPLSPLGPMGPCRPLSPYEQRPKQTSIRRNNLRTLKGSN